MSYDAPDHVPEGQRVDEFRRYVQETVPEKWEAVWSGGTPYPMGGEVEVPQFYIDHSEQDDFTAVPKYVREQTIRNLEETGHDKQEDPRSRALTGVDFNPSEMGQWTANHPDYEDVDAEVNYEIVNALEHVSGVHRDVDRMIRQVDEMLDETSAHTPDGTQLVHLAYHPDRTLDKNVNREATGKVRYLDYQNALGENVLANGDTASDQYTSVVAKYDSEEDADQTISRYVTGGEDHPSVNTAILPIAAARANSPEVADGELVTPYARHQRGWVDALGDFADRYGHQDREPGELDGFADLVNDKITRDAIFSPKERFENIYEEDSGKPVSDLFPYDPKEKTTFAAIRPDRFGNYQPSTTGDEFIETKQFPGMMAVQDGEGDWKELEVYIDYTDMSWPEFVEGPATTLFKYQNGTTFEHARVNPFRPGSELRPIGHSEEYGVNMGIMAGVNHNWPAMVDALADLGIYEEHGKQVEQAVAEDGLEGVVRGDYGDVTVAEMLDAQIDAVVEGAQDATRNQSYTPRDVRDALTESVETGASVGQAKIDAARVGADELYREAKKSEI